MEDDTSFWVEESSVPFCLPMKRTRKPRLRKLEFIGWASKPLIEFLESIGKDTSKQLNQYDVEAIVNEYVNANKLANPGKKKKIMCDQRLYALFGRKSVSRIKIFELLEAHFAKNHNSSEDDCEYSWEEEGVNVSCLEKASKLERKPSGQQKKVPEIPKSCFAAVTSENIKLVYLKRTLVQDLVKAPESFADKVMSSFVRIKSDPNDFRQKNSHQLQQVTGVKMTSEAGTGGTHVHLQLSNYMKEIPIQMLSDDNFSEAECEDLRERVIAGLLKRPTVGELEEKAKMLHEDITKHWIPREIAFLQNLIDRANEKGWRRELYEYLERKKLLENSSEQEILLSEIPKVTADEVEPEAKPVDALGKAEEGNDSSPKTSHWEVSDINCAGAAGPKAFFHIPRQVEEGDYQRSDLVEKARVSAILNGDKSSGEMQDVDVEKNGVSPGISGREVKPTQVIELSDDEIEVEELKIEKHTAAENPEDCLWHYVDPRGMAQGPFSMTSLKRWNEANYFNPDFMVWKIGQSKDKAVLLIDAIRESFPSNEEAINRVD